MYLKSVENLKQQRIVTYYREILGGIVTKTGFALIKVQWKRTIDWSVKLVNANIIV